MPPQIQTAQVVLSYWDVCLVTLPSPCPCIALPQCIWAQLSVPTMHSVAHSDPTPPNPCCMHAYKEKPNFLGDHKHLMEIG